MIKSFEDLQIWQLARTLCNDVFQIMTKTPLKTDYKLKDQINGSSGSIMNNIAEGFERDGNKEFNQFLSIAKASCGETRSQLYRILDREYINQDEFAKINNKTLEISNKIGAFMSYLRKSDFKGKKYK